MKKLAAVVLASSALVATAVIAADETVFRYHLQSPIFFGTDTTPPPHGGNGDPGGGTQQPHIVSTSQAEESGDCPAGFLGDTSRTRDVNTWSDGSTTYGSWSDWDLGDCSEIAVLVSTTTESDTRICSIGYSGNEIRTRDHYVWSVGADTYGDWSDWNDSNCVAQIVGTSVETETAACSAGYTGNQTRTRTRDAWADGTFTYGNWSGWNTSSCVATITSTTSETETTACGTGYNGNQTRTRDVNNWADGAVTYGDWSAYNRSSCTAAVTSTTTDTETTACGTGYTGNQTRTRPKYTYSDNTVTYGSWSAYNRTSCVAQITSTTTDTETTACGTGYTGNQTRTRPKYTYADGAVTYGSWSTYNRSSCVAQITSTTTDTETTACGTGYTGNQTRTRPKYTYADGSVTYGSWSSYNRASCSAVAASCPYNYSTNGQSYSGGNNLSSGFSTSGWHYNGGTCKAVTITCNNGTLNPGYSGVALFATSAACNVWY